MKRLPTALFAALAIVLALSTVLFYRRWRDAEGEAARLEEARTAALARASAAEDALARLEKELALLAAKHDAVAASLAALAAPDPAAAAAAAEDNPAAIEPAVFRREPTVLRSLDEAELVYARALDQLDLETLWLLAADLLALGEPGYEKLIELFARLEAEEERFRAVHELWSAEEIVIGPFLQAVAERHEDILRFGLFLAAKDPEALPEPLSSVRRQVTDELGALFLGFYSGNDATIWNGYLDIYRKSIDENPDEDTIHALASIPTEEAVNYLLELLGRSLETNRMQAVVRALAWQRSKRTLPVLIDLRDRTADAKTRAVLEAAIRYLQRQD